jgi:hypothetical protein
MKLLFLTFFFILSGCANYSEQSEHGEFYTWVDERGQLRTERHTVKSKKPERAAIKAVPKKNNEYDISSSDITSKQIKSYGVNTEIDPGFDTSQFTSATEVDKKIRGNKLYTWNQNGQQIIHEIEVSDITEENKFISPKLSSGTSTSFSLDLSVFREAKEILLSDIISREIQLGSHYILNEITDTDYILIELDDIVKKLSFKAFINNGKVSLPAITLLNKAYRGSEKNLDIFAELTQESWSAYGYISGSINIPSDVVYILLQPSPTLGMINTNSGDITLSNLGGIQIGR